METREFDILIVGGGLAGSTLACALEPLGLSIALVESVARDADSQPSFDDRAIALAWGSKRIFDAIGLWDTIAPAATPIRHIHISEKGRFGQAHLDAAEESVPALGYVALARSLGFAIQQRVAASHITRYCPATVTDFNVQSDRVEAMLDSEEQSIKLSARLMVAADGGRSQIREHLGITTREWQYGQTAIVTNTVPGTPHENIAYERFTIDGPLALLPMTDNRFGVVLTVPTEEADSYLAMDDTAFLDELHARFGYRAGRFQQLGKRISYPLALMTAKAMTSERVALIGNAAHALHPISGQGFNLGLRDIAVLADQVARAVKEGADPGASNVLDSYENMRKRDIRSITLATDGLARLFSNPLTGIAIARGAGLLATDLLPGIRHRIARHAMGVLGHLPQLGRGLPLE